MEPGEMMSAEEAVKRADECIDAGRARIREAIVAAIVTAWHEGAQYGATESTRLAIKAIDKAFDESQARIAGVRA